LGEIVRAWKTYTAREINKHTGHSGKIWALDYFDRYIRDLDHLADARLYIRKNPVKAGLCQKPEDWPWSSASQPPDRERLGSLENGSSKISDACLFDLASHSPARLETRGPGEDPLQALMTEPFRHKGWHSRGYLPHLDAAGEIQALTFRLADALPAKVVEDWRKELEQHPTSSEKALRNKIARYEDSGHGSCLQTRLRKGSQSEEASAAFLCPPFRRRAGTLAVRWI
jgi:hypothetical protein